MKLKFRITRTIKTVAEEELEVPDFLLQHSNISAIREYVRAMVHASDIGLGVDAVDKYEVGMSDTVKLHILS